MINIWKNGKYEVKLEKEYNEHKILVDPENENNYVVLGNSLIAQLEEHLKAKMRLLFKHQSFVQHIFRMIKL